MTNSERIYHRQRHFDSVCKIFESYMASHKTGAWDEIIGLVQESNKLLIEEINNSREAS